MRPNSVLKVGQIPGEPPRGTEACDRKASNYRQHLVGYMGIVEFQDRLNREIRQFGFASFEEQIHHCCELVPL